MQGGLKEADMIGAKFGMLGERGGIGKYVEDGLLVWLDGKNNVGGQQHSDSSTKWVNLGSGGATYDAVRSSGAWEDDCAVFGGVDTQVFSIGNSIMSNAMKGEWTVQVVFSMESGNYGNYHGIFGSHGYSSSQYGVVGMQYENGNFANAVWGTSRGFSIANIPSQNIDVGKKYLATVCESYSQGNAQTYLNDGLVASVTPSYQLTTTQAFKIGSAYNSTGRSMIGRVYSLRIYTRKLTADELRTNYKVDKALFRL